MKTRNAGIRRIPSRPNVTSELEGSRSTPSAPPSANAWSTVASSASENAVAPIPRMPGSSDQWMPSDESRPVASSGKLPSRSGWTRRTVSHQP